MIGCHEVTVLFSGSFTDPGTADTHTIEWDFGDGSPVVTGTLTPTHVTVYRPVGGIILPVNKLELLAPWAVLCLIMASIVITAIMKRRKT